MDFLEALILGMVQGLTEFLPISSSGHLVLGKELLGVESDALTFEILVHAATVLATITVFRSQIWNLLKGLFRFNYNIETQYILKIVISMLPIMVVGLFFKDYVESLFGEGALLVGCMLIVTGLLLLFASRKREGSKPISYVDAFVIGLAQACAVLPGLSRSGSTISTGLLLGNSRGDVAQFSFLMVLVPILGEAFLEFIGGGFSPAESGIPIGALIGGFLSAYLFGLFACKVMINIVKRGKLIWFAVYCFFAGTIAIVTSLI